ncbi:MAG TPA: PP2C family protein-serine/threonine phosphatase [Terriglobia bacterium]|nr:PP2C family protein-serine/threonine phosphatase [Terriglobia bacterium]
MPAASGGDPLHGPRRFFDSIGNFWQRVTEGMEIQSLWAQFTAEARSSYSLYTREVDWDAYKRETGPKRFFKVARSLFWAMLMKLSPARRVFLLLALVFALLAVTAFRVETGDKQFQVVAPQNTTFILLSVGGLVFLLALELADRVTMKRDLEIAREIQHWLTPEKPPVVPGADIAFISRPANTVGGDYYDAFVLDGNENGPPKRLMMVIADVAGKSVPAALLMATFQASLRSLTTSSISLADLVTGMNRYACAHSLGGRRFTTAFFAELDLQSRALRYISAGHNPPIVERASGQLERLEVSNLPLGIVSSREYAAGESVLRPGDRLIIFTDGLVESMNSAEQEYGEKRLLETLKTIPVESAPKTLAALLASVDAFTKGARQHDDLTCLILHVA